MVATEDIAQTAVELLGQSWNGVRIVEWVRLFCV